MSVCAKVAVRGDLRHRAHEPRQQVNAVNRLIHQRTTPVKLPSPSPRSAVVVGLRAIPLHIGIADGQSAKAIFVDRLLNQLGGLVKTRWKNRRKYNTSFLARLDDLVAPLQSDLERLLDDNVLSSFRSGYGRFLMCTARRTDSHDVNIGIGQHRVKVVITCATVSRCETIR